MDLPTAEEQNGPSFLHLLPAEDPPRDEAGYVQSFRLPDERLEMLAFFQRWGFAVIEDVLTASECQETLDEFWARYIDLGLDRDDPATWERFWSSQRFGRMGIIGLGPDLGSRTQLANRQNPRVHAAFAAILGTEHLWSDHDRMGVMRPTRSIAFKNADGLPADVRDMPEWETMRPGGQAWLHLDCNPVEGYASIGSFVDDGSAIDFSRTVVIQAFLSLTDAPAACGGFHCVPGSHRVTAAWARTAEARGSTRNLLVPEDDLLRTRIFDVAVRRGCLVAWNSLLLHGNHPNRSPEFRAVQYLRMMPVQGTPYSPLAPDLEAYQEEAPYFEMSDLGRKLFGIEPWETES